MDASSRTALADALAAAFLAGVWEEPDLVRRGALVLGGGRRARWLQKVAAAVLELYPRPPLDAERALAAAVAVLLETHLPVRARPRVRRRVFYAPAMGFMPWPVPAIATIGELADRLELDPGHLAWLADARGLERTAAAARLRNYRYRWIERPGRPARVIEQPKSRLKEVQRWVLHEVLDAIPPHEAAHGFRRGRSVRSHAARHTGRHAVARFDLEDFFASIEARRVYGLLRCAGYPEGVAHTLTALCTNVVPVEEWAAVPRPAAPSLIGAHHRLGRRLAVPHLPQGAPTSPALASLCAFGLDRRLTGLATRFGATYTRYADDLAFSGDRVLVGGFASLRAAVGRIAAEEGFAVAEAKTTLVTRAGSQKLCGVVVNRRPNVPRAEYDRLKAILHDAARAGPAAANRARVPDFRAHLLGRIAWVAAIHPERGARLRARFDAIAW
jgi:hypothetical protein